MVYRLSGRMPDWKRAKAKEMSSNMTKPEKALWKHLCGKKIGVWVYKQKPMLGYIIDFWIPCGIAIEVDGPHHANQKMYDEKRDKIFKSHGIKTMRFSDGVVNNKMPIVIALIKKEVKKRLESSS
jgi:very-short-patch-repair endonuclease